MLTWEEVKIPDYAAEMIREPSCLRKVFFEGESMQDFLGFSAAVMEEMYQASYDLYREKNYKDASDAFIFLTTLNPYEHNYWLGLGMAEMLCESFEEALSAYAMAIVTDEADPLPYAHAAKCYRSLGDIVSAQSFVSEALEQIRDKDEFEELKMELHQMRQSMEGEE